MEMEPQRTTCNDLEKKKIAIKIGGGGGGIGAIILMSGVLATAALASAFVVTKKRRSSGKERHQNTPPEVNEQTPVDCPDSSSDVQKYPSCESTKEAEEERDGGLLVSTESLILDDKPGIESNGGTPGNVFDVETHEQIPSSISSKEDSGIIKDESQSSDETLRFDLKDTMDEEKIQLIEEDITIDISKEGNNFQQEEIVERETSSDGEIQGIRCKESVELTEMKPIEEHTEICCDQEESEVGLNRVHMEEEKSLNVEVKMEEKELEGCFSDDGEIIEETKEDVGKIVVELRNGNQEAINTNNSLLETVYSESHITDGQNAICPAVETLVIEQENVNGEEKEGVVSIENANIEEQLVRVNEKFDRPGGEIVPEKFGLQIIVDDGKIPSEKQEEFGVSVLKKEVILPQVAKDDGENKEIAENLKDHEDDVERIMSKEVAEEMVFSKDIEVKDDDGSEEEISEIREVNVTENILPEADEIDVGKTIVEEIAENLEINENETSVKYHDDDVERIISKEVAEEMVFPKDIGVKEEGISEIREVNETANILPEADEIDTEKTIAEEIEISYEIIATEKDDEITKMSEDNIKDYYNDEAVEIDLFDEVEESSVGTGDSSMDSNEEAVWPEVQGKFQEDKAINRDSSSFEAHQVKETEFNPEKGRENVPIMADISKSKMSFTEKCMGEVATLKMIAANPTWRIIILGMLSVLSSLSCSWLFGLPFVKLCLILFLSMVLTEIHGY